MTHLDRAYVPLDRQEPDDIGEKLLSWVKDTFQPDQVFSLQQLFDWCHSNGFLTTEEFLKWYHMHQDMTLEDYVKTLNK